MFRKDLLFITFVCVALASLWVTLAPSVSGNQPLVDKRNLPAIQATQDVIRQVDAEYVESWNASGIEPAPTADALTICRRLSLALTGTIPSFEELRQLEKIAEADQVDWWLDHLFSDRRYSDYLAERLARVYVGVEEGPFLVFRRRRFTSWLSDCLLENKPYDEIVRHLISDVGVWTEKPAVNFLTVTSTDGKPDEIRLAGRTARAFLGIRLDCMQCHDDNLEGRWAQSDFHELAAFYSEACHSITGVADKPRDYETQYLDAESAVMVTPSVPFDDEIAPADDSSSADAQTRHVGTRREQLADWVTHPKNDAFPRAIVNRTWALLFGKPLVEPIDNIPLEGPYPVGLESLAKDFVRNEYNLQHLVRSIAKTRVFQLSSRSEHKLSVDHEAAWAVFPLTRLRPEQVAGSLLQSARLMTINADTHLLVRLDQNDKTDKFIKRYGDTGEDEFGRHGGTIPQRLLMMNGNLVKEKTKEDLVSNAATRISALSPDDRKAIRAAFLTVLTREPSQVEIDHFFGSLEATKHRTRFFEDLYWTLLNSTEASWNH